MTHESHDTQVLANMRHRMIIIEAVSSLFWQHGTTLYTKEEKRLTMFEHALVFYLTMLLIISILSFFVRNNTDSYFAITFFNFLFISLHIVLFISPTDYFTKAEIGICLLYLTNMFKLDGTLCFDKKQSDELDQHLPIMFGHYQSIRWLLFWIYYSLHKDDKKNRIETAKGLNFEDFTNEYSRWWFVRELWDYKYVGDVQNLNKNLYNAIIEYESI
ncbi:hypothetical protein RhiirA1_386761 [Rhizophagus irregularis]|uniref:Uncharacterized protein n=1 Tax=Rhizophagus irregularis TaxID=588596 RepID=A0A2I1E2L4_9GLOM|nr:hypothetical protein RhiirA1_386761 [Rhizophagus irregularis]PKY16366.1 hypothetical protein RhiirB3_381691 [Rhizophagus irregularis]